MADNDPKLSDFLNSIPPELRPGDFMRTMEWAHDYAPESLVYKQCFVGLVDILGYRQLIQSVGADSPNKIFTNVLHAFSWAKCANDAIRVSLFSDTLILVTADSNPVSFWQLAQIIQRFRMQLLEAGYLIRGAIALGPHFDDKDIWISPCLIRAYELESGTAVVSRVLIDRPALDCAMALIQRSANGVTGIPHQKFFVSVEPEQVIRDYDGSFVLDLYSDSIELLYLKTGIHPDAKNLNQDRIDHCVKAGNDLLQKYRNGIELALQRSTDTRAQSKVQYLVQRWNGFCSNFVLEQKLIRDYRIDNI